MPPKFNGPITVPKNCFRFLKLNGIQVASLICWDDSRGTGN